MTNLTLIRREDLSSFGDGWWLAVLLGVASIIAGVIVIAVPNISLVTLAWVAGVFLLVDGVFELAGSFGSGVRDRALLVLLALLSIVAGLFLIRHPVESVVVVALLLGGWFVAVGILRFIEAFDRAERQSVWNVVVAVLEIIAGVVIFAWPGIGVITLAVVTGLFFILRGIVLAGLGWALRSVKAS